MIAVHIDSVQPTTTYIADENITLNCSNIKVYKLSILCNKVNLTADEFCFINPNRGNSFQVASQPIRNVEEYDVSASSEEEEEENFTNNHNKRVSKAEYKFKGRIESLTKKELIDFQRVPIHEEEWNEACLSLQEANKKRFKLR